MEKKLSEIWWEKGTETNTSLFITNAHWKEKYDKILSLEAKIEITWRFVNYFDQTAVGEYWGAILKELESELHQIKEQEGL